MYEKRQFDELDDYSICIMIHERFAMFPLTHWQTLDPN